MSIKIKENAQFLNTPTHSRKFTLHKKRKQKPNENCIVENLRFSGDALMEKVTDLIKEGNIHRIVIQNKEGYSLLRLPTSSGVMNHVINGLSSSEVSSIDVISAVVSYPTVRVEKFRTSVNV